MPMTHHRHAASLAPLLVAIVLLIAALVMLAIPAGGSSSGSTAEDVLAHIASEPARGGGATDPSADSAETTRRQDQQSVRPVTQRPTAAPIEGKAPLEFDIPFLDLGIIQPGTVHDFVVGVTNTSDKTLTLKRIHTGCNCTTAYFETGETTFAPGETHNLVLETEARYKLTTKAVSVNISMNEYQGAARFTVRFDVNNKVAASPSFVNARNRRTGWINLRAVDNQPFRVLSVDGKEPVFSEKDQYDPETDDPRRMYTVQWDYTDMSLPPRLCVIETDHPESRIFGLVVYNNEIERAEREHFRGSIGGPQTDANLGYVTPGESREITVKYTNVPVPSTLRAYFLEHDDVLAEIVDTNPGEEPGQVYVTFRIDIDDELEPGVFLRPLNIESGDSKRRLWLYGLVDGTSNDAN